MHQDYLAGMSTSQIAKKLNTQPIRYNEKNSEWERGNVSYIFKDKAYLGNEDYPQIIEKEINDAVLALTEKNVHRIPEEEQAHAEVFKDKMRCSACGGVITRKSTIKGRKDLVLMKCQNKECECNEIYIHLIKLEEYVKTLFDSITNTPDLMNTETQENREAYSEEIEQETGVDYTNLRGGSYTYVVQVHDALGRGNREISIPIIKEKKLYEHVWFNILLVLLILAFIFIGARYYVLRKTRILDKRHRQTMSLISEITEAFAKIIDMKDSYTNGHSSRVAKYTEMLARELGCDDETVEKYYRIALLHDIGKVGIPPEVLNKPGKLTDEEYGMIKSHTTLGYEALKDISIMPELAIGAQAHHERPDGCGYPNGLKGDEIPRVAQIIAVADCFDAMYSNRPYRNRMNFEKAVSIIKEVSGTQLTSDVVDAFIRLVERGEMRDPEDTGGGSMENIENIRNSSSEE